MALSCIKCENLAVAIREYPCKGCSCRDSNNDKNATSHFTPRKEISHSECKITNLNKYKSHKENNNQ